MGAGGWLANFGMQAGGSTTADVEIHAPAVVVGWSGLTYDFRVSPQDVGLALETLEVLWTVNMASWGLAGALAWGSGGSAYGNCAPLGLAAGLGWSGIAAQAHMTAHGLAPALAWATLNDAAAGDLSGHGLCAALAWATLEDAQAGRLGGWGLASGLAWATLEAWAQKQKGSHGGGFKERKGDGSAAGHGGAKGGFR